MGWLELKAWIRELNRQRSGEQPDPESWRGRDQDPWWRDQDELRARRAGM